MVEEARFRDRRSFGSDGNHAAALGVCRRTVIRWKQQLEAEGRIIRCGWHSWAMGKRTVVYTFPPNVTRRSASRRSKANPSPSGLRIYRYGRTNALGCHAKRGEMSELEPVKPASSDLEKREHTAQDVVRTLCDAFAAESIPIHPRHKGIIARQAKESLDAGYQFETVVIAGATALRRGQPQNLHFIVNDLVMAGAGKYMTRREYEKALQDEMELR